MCYMYVYTNRIEIYQLANSSVFIKNRRLLFLYDILNLVSIDNYHRLASWLAKIGQFGQAKFYSYYVLYQPRKYSTNRLVVYVGILSKIGLKIVYEYASLYTTLSYGVV